MRYGGHTKSTRTHQHESMGNRDTYYSQSRSPRSPGVQGHPHIVNHPLLLASMWRDQQSIACYPPMSRESTRGNLSRDLTSVNSPRSRLPFYTELSIGCMANISIARVANRFRVERAKLNGTSESLHGQLASPEVSRRGFRYHVTCDGLPRIHESSKFSSTFLSFLNLNHHFILKVLTSNMLARSAVRALAAPSSRLFSSSAARNTKVAVLGAGGGIGQPLSLLLKSDPLVTSLSLYDIRGAPGVAADVSHVDTGSEVRF
jgi:hypothetical protein